MKNVLVWNYRNGIRMVKIIFKQQNADGKI